MIIIRQRFWSSYLYINFENICIYLDAHLCHDHLSNQKTFGDEDSATPIKLELNFIQNYLNKYGKQIKYK